MSYYSTKDLTVLLKKYDFMAIKCYYDNLGILVSEVYCNDSDILLIDSKPSKIINVICELYNNDDYAYCSKKTKKIILCDKKIPVLVNDEYGSIWLPFGSTNNDNEGSIWLNMNFISLNPHNVLIDKKNKFIELIFQDGQKIKLDINYKNFMAKWGEGAALKYEIDKIRKRITTSNIYI